MLEEVVEGVHVRSSEFMASNTVVIEGGGGVLVVDAGIRSDELTGLAAELTGRGMRVVAGFSTHPHWDHLLWHTDLGDVPRWATQTNAAMIAARLADPDWRRAVAAMIPGDLVAHVPLDEVFGRVTGLTEGADRLPWEGPELLVVEHGGHAPGHAALVATEQRVLIAGDMLSDVLVPMPSPFGPDPIGAYLEALDTFERAAAEVTVAIPGHGSPAVGDDIQRRIDSDRAYVTALGKGVRVPDDRFNPFT